MRYKVISLLCDDDCYHITGTLELNDSEKKVISINHDLEKWIENYESFIFEPNRYYLYDCDICKDAAEYIEDIARKDFIKELQELVNVASLKLMELIDEQERRTSNSL